MLDTVSGSATYAGAYMHAKANGCAPPAVAVRPGSVRCCGADGRPSAACAATASGKSARTDVSAVLLSIQMHLTLPFYQACHQGPFAYTHHRGPCCLPASASTEHVMCCPSVQASHEWLIVVAFK